MSLWNYWRVVFRAALGETFSHARKKILLGLMLSIIAFLLQWRVLQLRNWTDTEKIITSLLGAALIVMVGSFAKSVLLGPVLLHRRQQSEIEDLSRQLRPTLTGKMTAGIFHFSVSSNSKVLSLQPHIFLRASLTNANEALRMNSWKLGANLEGRTLRVHGPLTISESYVFYRSQPKLTLGLTTIVRETEYPTKRLNDPAGALWQPHEIRIGWLYFTVENVDENHLRDNADLTLEIADTRGRTNTITHKGGDSWSESWEWLDSKTMQGDLALGSIEGNKPPASLRHFN